VSVPSAGHFLSTSSPLYFTIFGSYQRESEVVFAALSKSAPISLEIRHPPDSLTKFRKPDGSLVTTSEFIIQAHILNILITSFPSDVILAEESLKGELDAAFLTEVTNGLRTLIRQFLPVLIVGG
jgi:hypothetical protein